MVRGRESGKWDEGWRGAERGGGRGAGEGEAVGWAEAFLAAPPVLLSCPRAWTNLKKQGQALPADVALEALDAPLRRRRVDGRRHEGGTARLGSAVVQIVRLAHQVPREADDEGHDGASGSLDDRKRERRGEESAPLDCQTKGPTYPVRRKRYRTGDVPDKVPYQIGGVPGGCILRQIILTPPAPGSPSPQTATPSRKLFGISPYISCISA